MSDPFVEFEKRLDRLERRHRELAKGDIAKINPDGLISVEPQARSVTPKLPLLLAAFAFFVLLKAALLSMIGQSAYAARISALGDGTTVEKFAAWVMQDDPVSHWISSQIGTLSQNL